MPSSKSMFGGGRGDSALVSGEKYYSGSGPFLHEKLNVIKMLTWNIIGSSYILYTHTQYNIFYVRYIWRDRLEFEGADQKIKQDRLLR